MLRTVSRPGKGHLVTEMIGDNIFDDKQRCMISKINYGAQGCSAAKQLGCCQHALEVLDFL